jgi:DNA-directed RNA polymerase subunit RPC12/RpoP
MAIQFTCTHCGQPIEVDDEHAGRTAACPYCQHLVTVPQQSTFDPHSAVPARPLPPGHDALTPPGATSTDAGTDPGAAGGYAQRGGPGGTSPAWRPTPEMLAQQAARQRLAQNFGSAAVACAAVTLLVLIVLTIRAALVVQGAHLSETMPADEASQAFMKLLENDPWVPALGAVLMVAPLGGLLLGILSVLQQRHGNWRGYAAAIFCTLFVLCVCGGSLLSKALHLPGLPS